ncbi:MAG: hypothetical protein Kow00120_11760 [Anaerolineae bacterium]
MPPDNGSGVDSPVFEYEDETLAERRLMMHLASRPTPPQLPVEHEGDEKLVVIRGPETFSWRGFSLWVEPGKKKIVYVPGHKSQAYGPGSYSGLHRKRWWRVLLRLDRNRPRRFYVVEVDLRKRAFPVEVLAVTRDAVELTLCFEILYHVKDEPPDAPEIIKVHQPLCQLRAIVSNAAFVAVRAWPYDSIDGASRVNGDPLEDICTWIKTSVSTYQDYLGLSIYDVLLREMHTTLF